MKGIIGCDVGWLKPGEHFYEVDMDHPQTRKEWQEAVDGAAGLRAIADCKMYGLIEGGPKIDVHRCDEILRRARKRGFAPSRPVTDLAIGLIGAMNAEADEKRRA